LIAPIPYDAIKKSATFIYYKEGEKYKPNGTGFLAGVNVETNYDAYVIYLVTAKHVLQDGHGNFLPLIANRLNKRDGSKLQGAVQGVAGSFGGLASIVGLTLGGFLYNSIGGATFLISAGVILAVFVMSFRLLKKKEA
jgi:MFS transporter, DHA1 family, tetracycline resistance protein